MNMQTDNIVELVVMVGVIWNALLQTYWFFWSRKIQERKHTMDDGPREIPKFLEDRIDFLESELSDAIVEISKLAKGEHK
jgi:hypothetical protein